VTTCKLVYTDRSVVHGIASFPGLLHLTSPVLIAYSMDTVSGHCSSHVEYH